ncbi:GNAT family N-acetyltransferase [Janibacter alittae]|uniref:GNAT family N-acetyltransferase n=1 Tax=Janibacter alittae TaxID=3115209 RepID=A0ABZ2MGV4_9MICO
MVDVGIRVLDEDAWSDYRDVRLAALREAPSAFVARVEDEAAQDESFWRARMRRAHRIVAERGGEPVGTASVGLHDADPGTGEVFGLWTAPTVRGQHVARRLVSTARDHAAEDGLRLLYFWVVSDNAAAIGFASRFGFRPTAKRRPVRVPDGASEKDVDEVAMVLPLSSDPTQVASPLS